jgi:glutamyl-tRNA synthetase
VVAAGLATEAGLAERADWFERVVTTEQERIRLYSELPDRIRYLFAADQEVAYDEKAAAGARKHAELVPTLQAYRDWLAPRLADGVRPDELRTATKDWIGERGLKLPALFQPLRCSLTGLSGGPDLFDIMALLGSAATLRRIDAGLRRLPEPS